MRIVPDTNVLISAALQSKGFSARLQRLWQSGSLQVATSPAILREYRRVLTYPHIAKRHHLNTTQLDQLVHKLEEKALVVPGTTEVGPLLDDPDDHKFLACAVEASAAAIVTGDDHLLRLEQFRGIDIVTPRDYVERFVMRHLAA